MEKVISIVNDALRGLCAWLSEAIYSWMTSLYEFFMQMGNMFYNGELDAMYKKVSLIIGIFMVFRVTFWLIETLINPDYLNDKEKSPVKIIQKVLVVVVLLGTTPSIFNLAYRVQDEVITSDLISNILGSKGSTPTETGRYMAAELFSNFYTLNELEDGGVDSFCNNMKSYYYESLSSNGKLTNLSSHSCLSKKAALKTSDEVKPPKDSDDDNEGYVVNFDGLLAVGVGVVILWLLLMYCISVGTRYVQLIFLQVIAPIPIMCYLTPKKDSMFSKWLKQCTTTYLDLFIRVAIINFVMVLINLILGENGILSNIMSSTGSMWIEIFMILGLLTFAKKAPDLIQELLPKSVTKASGDFGLSWKKRTESMLGGKMIYGATTGAPKKAIGFMATVPNTLKNAAVRAYGAHKYNQRQDEKIENVRSKRLNQLEEARNRTLVNQKLNEAQRKKVVGNIDKLIEAEKSKSVGQIRKDLAKQNKALKANLNRTDNPETQAKLMERIDENRASGMGHRNQAVTLATSLVGGTTKAFSAAMTGKKVGEIVRRANENQVKQITRELGWYQDNGYSFSQVAQRTISEVQRRFGIETQGQAVKYIIDSMDSDIKSQEEGVSKAKEIQQAYGNSKSSVKAVETEGEADLNKNKEIKVYNSNTGNWESIVLSTRTGEMNGSLERVKEYYNSLSQTSSMKSVQSGKVIRDAAGNIISNPTDTEAATMYKTLENLIESISKNCSPSREKQEATKAELTKLLDESDNFESAFNTIITASNQKISKSKSDYGKEQGAAALYRYILSKDPTKGTELDNMKAYKNQTVINEYESLMRELNTNSGRYSSEILNLKQRIEGITNNSKESLTEQSLVDLAEVWSELKDKFDVAQAEQSIVVSNLTDELQATKHQNTAFKNYTGTTDKINADKYEGPHGGPHGGHH